MKDRIIEDRILSLMVEEKEPLFIGEFLMVLELDDFIVDKSLNKFFVEMALNSLIKEGLVVKHRNMYGLVKE